MSDGYTEQEKRAAVLAVFDTLNRVFFGGELPQPGFALDDYSGVFGADTLAIFLEPGTVPELEQPAIFVNLPNIDKAVSSGEAETWITALLDTMLHELIHYHCYLKGIEDHHEDGYHTESFRDEARAHGLVCEWRDGGGWSVTYLSQSGGLAVLRALDDDMQKALDFEQSRHHSRPRRMGDLDG